MLIKFHHKIYMISSMHVLSKSDKLKIVQGKVKFIRMFVC